MSGRKALFIPISMLVLVAVTMAVTLRGQSQDSSVSTNQEDATEVQRGVASEKQKEHGKLFKQQGLGNIYELARKKSGGNGSPDINITVSPGMPELSPTGGATLPANTLENLTSNADAIVVVTVKSKVSQLTESENFIFTDYEVTVTEVLKDNSDAPLVAGNGITIVRPGGAVRVEGRVVRAIDRSAKPLQVGKQYLFFLCYIPATGAYQAAPGASSFNIVNNKLVSLTDDALDANFQNGKDAAPFINEIQSIVATTKQKRERHID